MARETFNQQSLGQPLNRLVKEARILMVGAGGIGCELLKNLVLAGFGEVHIVDLDTIDLSNLNRQFLFRHEHIKKSKALVAKDAAHRFNPNVKLEAHFANIKDQQFDVDWFKAFMMVFNALDNLDARRHVNKMCLAADIPLIESGTTGFNGQVQVIKKGQTACYDCTTKEAPKSFPVCTIRSTPSQPIHCIVWGKSYLLAEIFGLSEDETAEVDTSQDSENAEEIKKLKEEAEALKKIRSAMGTEAFPQIIFDKVYKHDVDRLRSMEDMWKTRKRPEPLDYASTVEKASTAIAAKDEVLKDGQRIWTLEENVAVFIDSLDRLTKRMQQMQKEANGAAPPIITFDKDDEDTLDFVTATANIRSTVFGIESKSRFDVKQMAGNIIPAIATTNAITAGLCVLESYKVLRGDFSAAKEVFLSPFASERLMASDRSRPPNPDCAVCSPAQTRVVVDMSRATLGDLVEDFLRVKLKYDEIAITNEAGGLLYDIDETDNLSKKFGELGIKDGSFLTIKDDGDDEEKRVDLILNVREAKSDMEGTPIKAVDAPVKAEADKPLLEIPRRPKPPKDTVLADTTNGSNGVTNGTPTAKKSGARTATEALGENKRDSKRFTQGRNDDELIVLDDDNSIVID